MKRVPRKVWLLLGAAVALILIAVLVLPFLVDADRYRGLIEAKAEETLGRDVRLGEIRLSILPSIGLSVADVAIGSLPEEGGGDLMTAESLRIGARLVPLLSRRLEVTSIVFEEPTMVLFRDGSGIWNVERLAARTAAEEDTPGGRGEVSIASLRLTGGRLTVRDESFGDRPLELVLTDLDLKLEDFQPGSFSRFTLATAVESTPGARLELSGEGGLLAAANDGPRRLAGRLKLGGVTGPLLADIAGLAGLSLEGVLGERAFDASGRFDAELGDRNRVELSEFEIAGVDVLLSRELDGSWNFERLGAGSEPPDEDAGAEIAIDALRLTGGSLTVQDASASRSVTLTGLDLRLQDYRPGSTASFELQAAFESSLEARLQISGSGPLADSTGRLKAEVKAEDLPGALVAELSAFGGLTTDRLFGDRPLDASARLDADLAPRGSVDVSDLKLTGADLDLRRDRGGRWNFALAKSTEESDAARPLAVRGIEVESSRVHLRDESAGTEPVDLELAFLHLELDRLPTDGPANLRLAGSVAGPGGVGELEVSGRLGPVDEGSAPVELSAVFRQLPLAAVRPLLAGVDAEAGTADLDLRLAGSFPSAYSAAGSFDLTAARIATDGRTLDLELGARFDVAARRGVEALDFEILDLDLGGNALTLRGSVEQVGTDRRWDLSLAPARLPAEDLAALLELLVADFSMSFASEMPVTIEGRARGLKTADQLPDLEGRLELRGFRLSHPSLGKPIEKVSADVVFASETVRVTGLAADIAGSDLEGRLTLEGWERPRVTFDLASRRADLGEILEAFGAGEATDATTGDPAEPSLLEHVTAEGGLRVDAGSWNTLEFTDLTSRMKLEGGVLTLDPVDLRLYGGAFDGRIVADLRISPAAFEIRGDATRVDTEPFLAANLEVRDALYGRFTGKIQARGAGHDYDSIVRSLTGGGSARLDDGRLGRLDLLATVARVSGVLGQRTLASLANRLATESTRFDRLDGRFDLAGGTLTVTELVLESPDFGLQGQVRLDLLASTLGGQFELAFSELLSESMRREASRAGELFWNQDRRRVVLPLDLGGSFEAPVASVDWSGAVERYAKERAARKITDLLAEALGSQRKAEERAAPVSPSGRSTAALEAEITGVRWGGSILFQDLKLAGVVRGPGIDGASLLVVDADDREVERRDRLPAVDDFVAARGDRSAWAEIAWEARIDGRDLAAARFPLRVIVTVTDVAGQAAVASTRVEK